MKYFLAFLLAFALIFPAQGQTLPVYADRTTGVLDYPTNFQAPIANISGTTTSANFFTHITDETGTGFLVGSISPALTGTPTVNGVAIGTGSGSVTSFSAGNLSPLFTSSVATATSTPALTFTLSNAAQNSVFAGPASGGAGVPSFQTAPTFSGANLTAVPSNTSLYPVLNQNTTGTAASFTGSLSGDVTGTQGATTVGKINGTTIPSASSTALGNAPGAANGFFQLNGSGNFPSFTLDSTATATLAGTVNVTGTLNYSASGVIRPESYGALGNAGSVQDAAITSGTSTLTSATANFISVIPANTLPCPVVIPGAGASGASLSTTITAINSSTSVTIATPASTTVSAAKVYWGQDDTSSIQSAINASKGGEVVFANKEYRITSPLIILSGVTLEGASVHELTGSLSLGYYTVYIPMSPPYISGSVLLMTAPATDFIDAPMTTVPGASLNIYKLGLRVCDLYKWSNTGNGIYSLPPTYSGYPDNGLMASNWSQVYIYGIDGNHYAAWLTNTAYDTFTQLITWGGGGFRMDVNNNINTYFGNSDFYDCDVNLFVQGTAQGFYFHAINGVIDHNALVRCQSSTYNVQGVLGPLPPYNSGGATPQYVLNYDTAFNQAFMESSWEALGGYGVGPKFPTGPGIMAGPTSLSGSASNSGSSYNVAGYQVTPFMLSEPLYFQQGITSMIRDIDVPGSQFYQGFGVSDSYGQDVYTLNFPNRYFRGDIATGTDGQTFTYTPYFNAESDGTFQSSKEISSLVVHAGLLTPVAPAITNGGTAGSTSYSYEVAAVDSLGNTTPASSAGTTTTGNATLSGTNYNTVSFNNVAGGSQSLGAASFNIYRTAGGTTQGLIGNVAATGTTATLNFNDTGLSASGSAPSTDTTGNIQTAKINGTSVSSFVTGNSTGVGSVFYAASTSTTTITNSTTLTTAGGCTTTGLPAGTYTVEGVITEQPSTSQSPTFQLLASNSATWNGIISTGPNANGGSLNPPSRLGFNFTQANLLATYPSANAAYAQFNGVVEATVTIPTAGTTISWQFAQTTAAGAGNTMFVQAGWAWLKLTRVQ